MRTYTEAQYATPSARAMILGWLGPDRGAESIDRVARYMRDTLRIGGIRVCRALVRGAIAASAEEHAAELARNRAEDAAFERIHGDQATHEATEAERDAEADLERT
jgi:hypothetical protein